MVWVRLCVAAALAASLNIACHAAERIVPRTVIALYDGNLETSLSYMMAEMPLNHLGLKVEYRDVSGDLPDLDTRADIRGVLMWLGRPSLENAGEVYAWVADASTRGLPVAILGGIPVAEKTPPEEAERQVQLAASAAGMRYIGNYRPYAYDVRVVSKDGAMVEFERKLPLALPAVDQFSPLDPDARSHLVIQRGQDKSTASHVIVTTSKGGFAAADYSHYQDKLEQNKAWYLNPFKFFAAVFRTKNIPVADVTTVSGRRIFYSHIDGDGWNSITEVDGYAGRSIIASEVILREIAEKYPDWPITVAPIAGDLDPAWTGSSYAQEMARAFFTLDNIEAGTHTYTHPFKWGFFGPGYDPAAEFAFARFYRTKVMTPELAKRFEEWRKTRAPDFRFPLADDLPRAYGEFPFNLMREVEGSIAYINAFCPPGKKVEVLQWSGDALPFEAALAAVRRAGIQNINGWGSRFDGDLPSNGSVAPVGFRNGAELQIFPSHANENVYTALWKGRFFGFRYLITSLKNTESPRRIKPVNLYYHMYSGEKQAALRALREVMAYVISQRLAPVSTSNFARIAQGFFSIDFIELADLHWRISGRGALNTIRFEDAAELSVDFSRSSGVIGQTRYGEALYVALDGAVAQPELALTRRKEPVAASLTLIDARWQISGFRPERGGIAFQAEGFGPGDMTFALPPGNQAMSWTLQWRHDAGSGTRKLDAAAGWLALTLPNLGTGPMDVSLVPLDSGAQAPVMRKGT